jgi:polyhydroxyalkanoate synthesis repressor PhaR
LLHHTRFSDMQRPKGKKTMDEKLHFKKYANRRLYDTEKSAYVTLDNVLHVIRQGRSVEVVDAKTGEDVTAFTLTQIILEESRKKNNLLPIPLLHLIIQYGENILSEFFDKYLEQTLKNYLSYKATADDQFRKWLSLGMDFSSLTKSSMASLPAFQSFFDLLRKAPPPEKENP